MDSKIEQAINQITSEKNERKWLRQLISIGKIQEEDFTKTKLLIDEFHSLPKDRQQPIESFKDDSELFNYLSKFKINNQKNKSLPADGWTLLEDYTTDNDLDVKLYNITNQEALDAIAGSHEAAWCCLTRKNSQPILFR
jgi:hypothetical protein